MTEYYGVKLADSRDGKTGARTYVTRADDPGEALATILTAQDVTPDDIENGIVRIVAVAILPVTV